MTNDENTVLDDMKGWLRDRGLTKSNLKSYKYWVPYTVARGKAWTPQSHGAKAPSAASTAIATSSCAM